MTTDHIAHSTPRRWLRLDGLTLFAAAIALFATTGQTLCLLPLVILLPDLFMVGYMRGTRVGAHVYNLGHTYLIPAALSLASREATTQLTDLGLQGVDRVGHLPVTPRHVDQPI